MNQDGVGVIAPEWLIPTPRWRKVVPAGATAPGQGGPGQGGAGQIRSLASMIPSRSELRTMCDCM